MNADLSRRTCDFCHKLGTLQRVPGQLSVVRCQQCHATYGIKQADVPAPVSKSPIKDHETNRVEKKDARYVPDCEFDENYGRFIRWYFRNERRNDKRWGIRDLQRRGFEVTSLVMAEDGREIKSWEIVG